MLCNILLQVHGRKSVQSFVSNDKDKWKCEGPSTLTSTMSMLDSKGLYLPGEECTFPSQKSWTWTFNLLPCSIVIVCCTNAKSDNFYIERNHQAILDAYCWFRCIDLTTEVKYSQMSLRQNKLHCFLTYCIIGFDTKPTESKVKKNVASKKVVPFVKPLSCFKVEGSEFL